MIPGDLLSACPHRQSHTLPGLLDSWAALPNSYPNALRAMQGGSLYLFMMVFGMTRLRGELTTYHARGGHAFHDIMLTLTTSENIYIIFIYNIFNLAVI